ncbi:IQ calmodulin-binding motif family protein [Tritrichomonas foetus]|uniref:IQ calmodulin-binding motif family protein n=1 Tax=Tritrichomonas foetus TaxID=1144522 RepID=A0A1J4KFS7_9EUKA|nr:IQ calmodulin-binding motif family protein [Tritrichomonas foetus]|eukprot:OHT10265.1 IQ calmodulin-binding motif family protein [Tritrichomonas foetus]
MGELLLTEEILYDAAEIPNKSIPINEIKYIGFSVQPFTNISLILKAPKLEIVILRVCSFKTFPEELFHLPNLKVLDLSGNAIQTLPDIENFNNLKELRSVNLGDNNIVYLAEVFKLSGAENLRQLILSGNICLSEPNSFASITKLFKKLTIFNDLILTSQHRAFLDDYANYSTGAVLPASKIDDFFFLYVRYLHAPSNERYVRRSNAEFFCLNRVIRKYSSAEKIQSVFRGYRIRKEFKKLRNAAMRIEAVVKLWYHKRLNAAIKIRSCFLYYSTRKKIRYIQAVRKVQSAWRTKLSRQFAMVEVFADINEEGKYSFIVGESQVDMINRFISERSIKPPPLQEVTKYKLVKKIKPVMVKLPGSPIIYYGTDKSSIVRFQRNHQIKPNFTIWCRHDHAALKSRKKVTRFGINWTNQCPFSSIPAIKGNYPKNTVNLKKYDALIKFTYENREDFASFITQIICSKLNITIYPERTIIFTASTITIQSASRMFIERLRHFREIKSIAIEKRALSCIRYSFKTMAIHRAVSHVVKVYQYYNSLPRQQSFYIPYHYYQSLISMKKLYNVDFGYSSDRSLVLDKSIIGFLPEIIPKGNIMFNLNDLSSLVSLGVISTKATNSMFSIQIPAKYIKRYRIMRITYANPEEARRRLALFAWMTYSFNIIMTENDVLEYCCANAIHSCWYGYSSRKRLAHILTQHGFSGKSLKVIRMIHNDERNNLKHSKPKYDQTNNQQNNQSGNPNGINKPKSLLFDPVESLHELRHDYRPWAGQLDYFKDQKRNERPSNPTKSRETTESSNNFDLSSSALNVGMVTADDFPQIATSKIDTRLIHKKSSVRQQSKYFNDYEYNDSQRASVLNSTPVSCTASNQNVLEQINNETDDQFNDHNEEHNKNTFGENEQEDQFDINEFTFAKPFKVDGVNSCFMDLSHLTNTLNLKPYVPDNIKKVKEQPKAKSSIHVSHSTLTMPNSKLDPMNISLADLMSKSNEVILDENNLPNPNLIEDNFLSSLDDEVSADPRLMAPFFTGSPKRKVRKIKPTDSLFSVVRHAIKPSLSLSTLLGKPKLELAISSREQKDKDNKKANESETTKIENRKQTAQRTENRLQDLVKVVFTKLVRLHHVGMIIRGNAIEDNTIENKRQVALLARQDLEKSRACTEMSKKIQITQAQQRASIEKAMLLETLSDQKNHSLKEKTKRIHQIKEEQKLARERFNRDRKFGQSFANMARKINQKAEIKNLNKSTAQNLFLTKSNVLSMRQSSLETKAANRELNSELEQQKRRLSMLDKIFLDRKRQKMETSKLKKLDEIYENKRKDKERRKLMKTMRASQPIYVPPTPLPQVQEDESVSAMKEIGQYLGDSMGLLESQLLVEMINRIIQ